MKAQAFISLLFASLLLLGCAGGGQDAGQQQGAAGQELGDADILPSGDEGIAEIPPISDEQIGVVGVDEFVGDLTDADILVDESPFAELSITQGDAEMEPVEPF